MRLTALTISLLAVLLLVSVPVYAEAITINFFYDAFDPISMSKISASTSWAISSDTGTMNYLYAVGNGKLFYRMYYDGAQFHVTLDFDRLSNSSPSLQKDLLLSLVPYSHITNPWGAGGEHGAYSFWYIDSNSAFVIDNSPLPYVAYGEFGCYFTSTSEPSTTVPEPSTTILLTISLVGLGAFTRRWWSNPLLSNPEITLQREFWIALGQPALTS